VNGIVFDAYGTLFDVYAVETSAEALFPGLGASIATLWRDKQIEYSRLRTITGHYASFWQLTQDALDFTLERLVGTVPPQPRDHLLSVYRTLPPHPETAAVLARLHQAGVPLAILSNADPGMMSKAAEAAGLAPLFTHILSADTVGRFKPAAEVYGLGPAAFGCAAGALLFVSSNGWDIAGASWFGYRSFWVNRAAAPLERVGRPPDGIGATLRDLPGFLGL
jgi:2-haloacid dehalogenase